jgi:rhamnosyltransferase
MKLLGIVILYYPDKDIEANINSYIDALDELIIWDNTPHGCGISFLEIPKIKKMGSNENVGIGKALNEAVNYAKINEFTHLLTMDQDSSFQNDDCKIFIAIANNAKLNAIFSPNYISDNKEWYVEQDSFIEVETTLTSGTLYPIHIFDAIGLFREDFFIDTIDTEFSLRARKNGIPTQIISSVHLFHVAGYQKHKRRFLWKTFSPNEYSPIRSYYIIRNSIITKKLYPWNNWKGYFYYWFYKRLFYVLCYENNKYAKYKGLILGYIHGRMGKTGRQTIFKEE